MIWAFVFFHHSKGSWSAKKQLVERTCHIDCPRLMSRLGFSCRRFVKWGATCLRPYHDLCVDVWWAGEEKILPHFVVVPAREAADPKLAPVPRCLSRSRRLWAMFYSGRHVVTNWTGWVCVSEAAAAAASDTPLMCSCMRRKWEFDGFGPKIIFIKATNPFPKEMSSIYSLWHWWTEYFNFLFFIVNSIQMFQILVELHQLCLT